MLTAMLFGQSISVPIPGYKNGMAIVFNYPSHPKLPQVHARTDYYRADLSNNCFRSKRLDLQLVAYDTSFLHPESGPIRDEGAESLIIPFSFHIFQQRKINMDKNVVGWF